MPNTTNEKQESKNKFQFNSNYFTICIYALFVILCACLIIRIFYHWDATLDHLTNLFHNTSSFLFGILIAFMVNPLVNYTHNTLLAPRVKSKRLRQGLAILISYLIVFGFLIICLVYVIPQLISSITDLSNTIPTTYSAFTTWLRTLAYSKDFLSNNLVNNIINTLTPKILEFSTNLASQLIPWLYSASISVIKWFVTFFIAIIMSIYLLSDKKIIFHNIKRFLYAFLPESLVGHSVEIAKNCNQIFTGYIVAKSIDSLIIGVLCFVLMSIFQLKYAILVSVIVGISNMIPYFGPYIGAIPGVFILGVIKLKYGLIFLVLIVALQMFDGLYLGPKLLGNSVGVRPILILFSITFFGAYFGVLGMFLGVPLVAVIQYLLNLLVTKRLKERNIEV